MSGAAYAARVLFFPDIVPIADADLPQPHLQLAFILMTIELAGVGGVILMVIAALPVWFRKRRDTRAVR
jgi:hypothetical protein